jgi:hypothetical protein
MARDAAIARWTKTGKSQGAKLLDRIPEPAVIRERLGECLREIRILRSLLRIAEGVAKDRQLRNKDGK